MSERRRDESRAARPEPQEELAELSSERDGRAIRQGRILIHFESDGHPEGYAVASGEPGVSGRWVTGATREEAIANWTALYEAGELNEHDEPGA